ncbi:MAG: Trp biosynthesis-associated membrane protein [Salinibacterium sp.]|nr:Trp biosynthesis-associated membrane protein [Salinibacterium sp.]MBF0673030.1 Trp biosynthesis-associated membrane protein [Salinibacterium sp.]
MTRLLRSKPIALAVSALLGGAVLLAWSQTWIIGTLAPGISLEERIPVGGDTAAPALAPLALAMVALVAALAIASRLVRVVLSVTFMMLGGAVVAVASGALIEPLRAATASVVSSTGLEGEAAVASAVVALEVTPWPMVALIAGALVFVWGIVLALTSRAWGLASARYDTAAGTIDTTAAAPSKVSDWDSLSGGDDPTSPSGSR